jgi:hypothetical protein
MQVARRLFNVLNFLILIASWMELASESAYAWGPGIHMIKGTYILENLHLILPTIAQLLRAFPLDFLYGCISADFFIGKGYRRRDDHCHNWSMGLKMLANAETGANKAFCYGYLAHLAADTIAHNYYIPNQLYVTSSTKRFGHVYWEFRSDAGIDAEYWELARRAVRDENNDNDASLEHVQGKKLVPLKTKKNMYVRMLNLTDLERWRRASEFVERNSRWDVSEDYIRWLRDLSISVSIDFLKHPEDSVCLDYDPVGTRNISRAKRLRRRATRSTGIKPSENIFEISEDLLECDLSPIKAREGRHHLQRLSNFF